jgi:hypothetical protein
MGMTTLGRERETNPFLSEIRLRLASEPVSAAAPPSTTAP